MLHMAAGRQLGGRPTKDVHPPMLHAACLPAWRLSHPAACLGAAGNNVVCQHPRERVRAREKVNLFLPTAEELVADDRKDLLQKVAEGPPRLMHAQQHSRVAAARSPLGLPAPHAECAATINHHPLCVSAAVRVPACPTPPYHRFCCTAASKTWLDGCSSASRAKAADPTATPCPSRSPMPLMAGGIGGSSGEGGEDVEVETTQVKIKIRPGREGGAMAQSSRHPASVCDTHRHDDLLHRAGGDRHSP